jgi:hypothetical protein
LAKEENRMGKYLSGRFLIQKISPGKLRAKVGEMFSPAACMFILAIDLIWLKGLCNGFSRAESFSWVYRLI